MNEFGGDMLKMQQDAIRRVREMQERARRISGTAAHTPSRPHFMQGSATEPVGQSREKLHPQSLQTALPQKGDPPQDSLSDLARPIIHNISNFIEQLGVDKDRALLLIILFVLLKEEADIKMILAICYLLL